MKRQNNKLVSKVTYPYILILNERGIRFYESEFKYFLIGKKSNLLDIPSFLGKFTNKYSLKITLKMLNLKCKKTSPKKVCVTINESEIGRVVNLVEDRIYN